ncbi:hypothetical protein [Isoptericola sp. AK164]|uniref:hypothetical protein n=1 Tax=Isoptericola sp. AK164 TaxID=3024246 RepID=UPI0024187051|nr:hypothetical protein [Isoptericola sp. AK164]
MPLIPRGSVRARRRKVERRRALAGAHTVALEHAVDRGSRPRGLRGDLPFRATLTSQLEDHAVTLGDLVLGRRSRGLQRLWGVCRGDSRCRGRPGHLRAAGVACVGARGANGPALDRPDGQVVEPRAVPVG